MGPLPLLWADPGGELYRKHCGTCHGDRGDGRGRVGVSFQPPATDFTQADPDRLTLAYIEQVIREGKPGTAMVGYGRRLSDGEIRALAGFIRRQFMGLGFEAGAGQRQNPGKAIYEAHCAACHGDNGNTAVWARNGLDPPPRDFTTPQAREELSRERMIASVKHGRPGTAMMPFGSRLSDEQIEQVVDYVRARFMGLSATRAKTPVADVALRGTARVDMNLPFANGLQGDAKRGESFYRGNCFTCHGLRGDGQGPRAHFNHPRPRDFTSSESRSQLNRPRLFQGIAQGRRGSVMPAWRYVLTEQQIADVAEYVFQAFIRGEAEKKSLP